MWFNGSCPPYASDLYLYNYFLFHKKEVHLENVQVIETAVTKDLQSLKYDFFEVTNRYKHCINFNRMTFERK